MFYISLDHFARIRSDAGISNSDLVLGEISSFIRGMVADEHTMARFGDDVLAVLYNGSDKEKAAELAEEIRSKVDGHMCDVSGKTYHLTLSIGLSLITENATTAEEIIARAHRAAEDVVNGNGVNFYQATQVTVGEDGKALTTEHIKELVKQALDSNTIKLVFQPVISLHGDDEEQFEVLTRIPQTTTVMSWFLASSWKLLKTLGCLKNWTVQ